MITSSTTAGLASSTTTAIQLILEIVLPVVLGLLLIFLLIVLLLYRHASLKKSSETFQHLDEDTDSVGRPHHDHPVAFDGHDNIDFHNPMYAHLDSNPNLSAAAPGDEEDSGVGSPRTGEHAIRVDNNNSDSKTAFENTIKYLPGVEEIFSPHGTTHTVFFREDSTCSEF
jgi:hypothetical protein